MSVEANKQRLAERTAKRAVTADAKKRQAEALKDEGNDHFRNQRWEQAIECYEKAIVTYGPRVTYLNNVAAVYLKVERYVEAEYATREVLKRDPRMVKARYRRALARKGQGLLRSALHDLVAVICIDDTCQEALREHAIVSGMLQSMPDYDEEDAEKDMEELVHPFPEVSDCNGAETPTLSDSSDFEHEGNSVPCRYYNHDGCAKGKECKFRHAPDNRSVRDRLGRNVCLYYMLELCKFPESTCNYAHDMTYLPLGPWNDSPTWYAHKATAEACGVHKSADILEAMAPLLRPPIRAESWLPRNIRDDEEKANDALTLQQAVNCVYEARKLDRHMSKLRRGLGSSSAGSSRKSKRGKTKAKGKVGAGGVKGKAKEQERYPWEEDFEDEMDERMANMGFTQDEMYELACQGVKPWDDDAWDVLHALSGM